MEDWCFAPKKSLITLSDLGLFSPVLPGCPEGWAEDRKHYHRHCLHQHTSMGMILRRVSHSIWKPEFRKVTNRCLMRPSQYYVLGQKQSKIKHDPNVYIKHRTPLSISLVTKGHLFVLREFKIQLVNHLGLKTGFNSSSWLDQERNLLTHMYKIQVSFDLKAPRVSHSLPFPFCLNVTRLTFALSSPSWWQDSLNYSSFTFFIIESNRKASLTFIQV